GSFVIVIAMMQNLGATDEQISSGLLAVCFAIGLTTYFLAYTTKAPITIAWSTPGAALIAGARSRPSNGDGRLLLVQHSLPVPLPLAKAIANYSPTPWARSC